MTQRISGADGAAGAPKVWGWGGDTGSTHLIVASRLPEHELLHMTNTLGFSAEENDVFKRLCSFL